MKKRKGENEIIDKFGKEMKMKKMNLRSEMWIDEKLIEKNDMFTKNNVWEK